MYSYFLKYCLLNFSHQKNQKQYSAPLYIYKQYIKPQYRKYSNIFVLRIVKNVITIVNKTEEP